MDDYQSSIEHFERLGGRSSHREVKGKPVLGIQLRNSSATDDDLRHLFTLRDELDVIGLAGTHVTDRGLQHLRNLPILDNIDLTDTEITDAGLEVLMHIGTLRWVHLEGTAVTRPGISKLEDALPHCEIVWGE